MQTQSERRRSADLTSAAGTSSMFERSSVNTPQHTSVTQSRSGVKGQTALSVSRFG